MAFDVGGKQKLRPSMNVTPLVDVVLVLLIIFMVVTPLLTKHLSLDVPQKPQDTPPPSSAPPSPPVVLSLRKDGAVEINREEVQREELIGKLKRMLNARADKVVFFDAQDDLPYGAAVELLDFVRGGGIQMIAVVPEAL